MGLRGVIYARQSLDRLGNELGVDRQIEDCTAWCRERNVEIIATLVDNSVSASSSRAGTEYDRMLDMMRACAMDYIVVANVDRLYRSMIDLEHIVNLSEAGGIKVATLAGDLDLATDTGRLVARILAAVARGEVERKGARQKRANRQRREAGVAMWTRRPFGYDRVGEQVIVVEAEARAIREMVADVLDGGTLTAQLRRLNEAGFLTTAGLPWNVRTVARVMMNPRYVGRVTHLGTDTGVTGSWPTILDSEVQMKVTEVLKDPARRVAPSTTLRYWLSGALTCGVCQGGVFAARNGPAMAYRCRAGHVTRSLALVDDVVERALLRRVGDPAFATSFAEADELAQWRADAAAIRQARDGIATLLADRLLTQESARPRLERLTEDLASVEARIASAAATSPLAAMAASADRDALWASWGARARRDLFTAAVRSCTLVPVGKGEKDRMNLIRSIQIDFR